MKLSATSFTYNGIERNPYVTVTNANGVKLTKDTHYTVTYATGRKNAYSIFYEGSKYSVHGYKLSVFAAPVPYMNFNFKF